MLADYADIRSRISEEPKWFDVNGVPRYDEFHPNLGPNIYADESVLFEICCQSCRQKFLVCLEADSMARRGDDARGLAAAVTSGALHYGDPPRHGEVGGCLSGDTMNCYDLRVMQFWRKVEFEWARVPELEVTLPDSSDPEAAA